MQPLPPSVPPPGPSPRARRGGKGFAVRMLAVVAAVTIGAVVVVTRSQAAFTDTTDNTGNAFSAGNVDLVDDDSGSVLFNASNLKPNDPKTACITVTYQGSLTPADVKLYASSVTGALGQYLDLDVEVGTGGSFASCSGFTPTSTLYSGTLAAFGTAHTGWANGLAAFTAGANPTARTFRFTVDVQDTNAAQSLSAGASFTWEAQNQ